MRHRLSVAALLLVLSAACGGDSTGPGPTLPNGSFSASIDGSNFNATSAIVNTMAGNIISVGGGNTAGQSLAFAWVDAGPDTYSVGPTSPTNAVYTAGAAGWVANVTGGSGSVIITTRTANRVAGTFFFDVIPSSASAAGTKLIRQGSFDLTF